MIRIISVLHGWLGIVVLPWVILLGLTGIYLNHSDYFLRYLPQGSYDEAGFDRYPDPVRLDQAGARALAQRVMPGAVLRARADNVYHGRRVAMFDAPEARVIVALDTGHYWVKTPFTRKTYDPAGKLLDRKIYWSSLFRYLHVRGWFNSTFGTWFSDIAAAMLVLFGLTGVALAFSRRRTAGGDTGPGDGRIEIRRRNVPRPKRITLKD